MSRIKRLRECYLRHIRLPWRSDVATAQRVIFCVYPPPEELRLRARLGEFELDTNNWGHRWLLYDLTDTFATWLAEQKYAQSYFRDPSMLSGVLDRYRAYLTGAFSSFCRDNNADESAVVAVVGAGSLFGLLKVKEVVDAFAPLVPGRLLVFFPGNNQEGNNYRLFDAYDGWDYLAVLITPECDD